MRSSAVVSAGLLVGLGVAVARPWVCEAPAGVGSIAETLDSFHAAAARADEAAYFGHFAPDGVFLGTDPGERWTVAEFRAWAKPYFSEGKGWAYHAVERHIDIAPDGQTGWFDEVVRNAAYGDLRGTGVLLLVDGEWKIVQYNLTFMVPNDDADAVLAIIKPAE